MPHEVPVKSAPEPMLFADETRTGGSADSIQNLIARVLVEDTTLELDYLVTSDISARVQLGSRVHVPLQGRRAVGVVLQLLQESSYQGRLKPVFDVIGVRPVFTPVLLKLAQWISS